MQTPSVTILTTLSSDAWAAIVLGGGSFTALGVSGLCTIFDSWLPWQLVGPVVLLIVYSIWLCRWTVCGRDATTVFLRARPHPLGRRRTVAILPSTYNSERCACAGCPGAFSHAPNYSYYWVHNGKLLNPRQEQMLHRLRQTLADHAANERRIGAAVKHLALPEETK